MAKVTINGEVFPFDMTVDPMSECLIIEMGLDCTYTEWKEGMRKGSAKAFAGFVWQVLHRNGRTDVEIKDILSGEYPIDLNEVQVDQESDPDPTSPPPAASSSTAAGTSASSPKSSGSGPGNSGGSPRRNSRA